MDERRIRDQALAITLDERIRGREVDARWYRTTAWARRSAAWREDRYRNLIELRTLRRLRRDALALAEPIVDREDAIQRAKAEALRSSGTTYQWDPSLALGDHHVGVGL